MGTEVKVSDPVVSFRETCTAKSDQTCLAKSANKHNRLFVEAEPLGPELCTAIDDGDVKAGAEAKTQGRYLADNFGWDVTEARKLERARRDLVENVSHELKTPLTAIKGFVETLQDDPEMPPETQARFHDKIARQTERLATLVADLLTISRLDDDKSPSADEPVDMVAVLRETVNDLLPIAEKRDLEFQANLPECAVWVVADRETLRQTAGNLVDNAVKYTPERGVVTVTLKLPTPDSLRLEVADTGIGLSAADQERIFERFYRVDRARSRELGGTGLGLSIVKNTVRNLGGDVGVKSALGVGSMFWLELPTQSDGQNLAHDQAR